MNFILLVASLLTQWQFAMEQTPQQMPSPNSSEWTQVTIPHDWAISGEFSRDNDLQNVAITQNGSNEASVRTGRTGGLPYVGCGWYKTTIDVPVGDMGRGQCYTLLFDGAMSEAHVYINGKLAEFWPYGYDAFHIDITPFLQSGRNEIAIRLENLPESSRWYPGAGLFRNVHLYVDNKTHIPVWGTNIWTKAISENQRGTVCLTGRVENALNKGTRVRAEIFLDDNLFYTQTRPYKPGQEFYFEANIPYAHLWSPESPVLYKAVFTVLNDKEEVDRKEQLFGIRTVEIVPNVGFLLNGQVRKFQGVCLHHDLGPLGAAVHKDAIRHQLLMLKDMGCDAIRTSHNMPAPELIDLCDELGFMVMVEPFDEWDWGKCKNGYNRYFNQVEEGETLTWAERDMQNMLLQFRPHPSVVMWSIGNEVPTQCDPEGAKVAKFLQDICKRFDPQRPVTAGMDQVTCVLANGFAQTLEVVGLNYRTYRYQEAYDKTPQKLVLGSETSSTVSSRGVYKLPIHYDDNSTVCNLPQPNGNSLTNQCTGYDLESCPWSNLPDEDLALQEDYQWTIGQFVWTGFDYLGEPSPYDTDAWPSHSSYFGIIDLASIPKDRYYLYRSVWNKNVHTLHILPHWNWQEGDTVPVFVYTDYPEAELFINGKSMGRQRKWTREEAAQDSTWGLLHRYRLMWMDVPYEPGEVKVVAYDENGKKMQEAFRKTAEDPFYIELMPETVGEITYVRIRILDIHNTLCPNADNMVKINVKGGELMGAANGDATCLIPFPSTTQQAFHGELTAVVRGDATITVTADGIEGAQLQIKTKK